jgi:hypothetical protein
VLLQQILPPLFNGIGILEGNLGWAQVQIHSFRRYYLFLVINILLVTTIASSVFETASLIAENPGKVFQLLGYSLPRTSSFFCYYIAIKIAAGLSFEMVSASEGAKRPTPTSVCAGRRSGQAPEQHPLADGRSGRPHQRSPCPARAPPSLARAERASAPTNPNPCAHQPPPSLARASEREERSGAKRGAGGRANEPLLIRAPTTPFSCALASLANTIARLQVRFVPILQNLLRYAFCPLTTQRDKRQVKVGCRPIDDPGMMLMAKIFPQDMLVVTIAIVYSIISPLVLIPCIFYVVFSRVVWTHQFCFV